MCWSFSSPLLPPLTPECGAIIKEKQVNLAAKTLLLQSAPFQFTSRINSRDSDVTEVIPEAPGARDCINKVISRAANVYLKISR